MGKISVDGMEKLELVKIQRKEKITSLTKKDFDLNNETHAKELAKYLIQFESYAHQMYLSQGLSYAIQSWIGYRAFNFWFPIMPQAVTDLMTVGLYIGALGLSYNKLSLTDFNEQLKEMKLLYNWVLKDNKENYSPEIDNSKLLANPLVQRMVEIMAPLCSTEFMIAWPKLVEEQEKKQISLLSSVASYGLSLFSSAPKADLSQSAKVIEMKTKVETRGYDLGVFAGLKRSIGYFISDKDCHELMKSRVPEVIDYAKETALELVPSGFSIKPKLI